jgi:esterase
MSLWSKESGCANQKTVIFLHGLLASAQNWQMISKHLSHDYHTVCVDLPNHGHSLHDERADYEFMLEQFIDFVEEKSYDNFHLVGHSLGGKLAMLYALQYPEKIDKLLVEDIAPKTYPMRYMPIMKAMADLNLGQCKNRKEIDAALNHAIPDKAMRMFVMTNLESTEGGFKWRVNLKSLIHSADKLMSFPLQSGSYSKDCMFLCGDQSDYVTQMDETVIKSYFNNCEINHIKGAGHWLHAEKSIEFCETLNSYFNN